MAHDREDLLAAWLKRDAAAALENEPWEDFSKEVMLKVDAVNRTCESSFIVRDDVEKAIRDRDGHWISFTEGVIRKVRSDERAFARLPIEEQAVEKLREHVEAETDAIEQRFEHDFFFRLRRRLANPSRPWYRQLLEWIQEAMTPMRAAMVLASAMVFLMSVGPQFMERVSWQDAPIASVTVDAIQFDGTVTVLDDHDVTVIWLADS